MFPALTSRNEWRPLVRASAAMLLLFYGTLYVVRPGELCGGDLRLGAMTGLVLGWTDWPTVAAGTLLAGSPLRSH